MSPASVFMGGFLIAGSLLLVYGVAWFIRIEWVYRTRMRVLHTTPSHIGVRAYDLLPSFDVMVRRFWVWNASKFVHPYRRADFTRMTGIK